jgi:hypothetical protein
MVRQNIYSFNSSTIRFDIEYGDAYHCWHGRSFISLVVYSVLCCLANLNMVFEGEVLEWNRKLGTKSAGCARLIIDVNKPVSASSAYLVAKPLENHTI